MKLFSTLALGAALFVAALPSSARGHGGGGLFRSYRSSRFPKTYSSSRSNRSYETVHGYMTRRGTYVKGYKRSKSDRTFGNNYSTRGNRNPFTGKVGKRAARPRY